MDKPTDPTMPIVINGEPRQVAAGSTVRAVLDRFGLNPAHVVVELDGQILAREEFDRRTVAPGARMEVVHFVGGG